MGPGRERERERGAEGDEIDRLAEVDLGGVGQGDAEEVAVPHADVGPPAAVEGGEAEAPRTGEDEGLLVRRDGLPCEPLPLALGLHDLGREPVAPAEQSAALLLEHVRPGAGDLEPVEEPGPSRPTRRHAQGHPAPPRSVFRASARTPS